MDWFDPLREHLFDELFSLDETSRQELARWLREHGLSEKVIHQLTRGGIQVGMTLQTAYLGDVQRVVERVLFRQGARGVTLQVLRCSPTMTGHLDIHVLDIQPAADGETAQPDGGKPAPAG
jgi:hypothetical protein